MDFSFRDAMSHEARDYLTEKDQFPVLQNLTDLLSTSFKSQFVFPALGHDDPRSRWHLGEMWRRWLPPDSMKTFETG